MREHSFVALALLALLALISLLKFWDYDISTLISPHEASEGTKSLKIARHTIVTAYYEFNSKHSNSEYREWMDNFLSLQDPMVIFTSSDLVPLFQEGRAKHNATQKTTHIVALDLNQTWTAQMFDLDFWKDQHTKDPERHVHPSYYLYWIWLAKAEFLQRAVDANPFQSDFFAWTDVGYFRTRQFYGQLMLRHIPAELKHNQILVLDMTGPNIRAPPTATDGAIISTISVGGGFLGGYTSGIRRWNDLFYRFLKDQSSSGVFIGKDQIIMYRACFSESPPPCLLLKCGEGHGDPWFYMAPTLILGLNETSTWEPSPHHLTDGKFFDAVQRSQQCYPANN